MSSGLDVGKGTLRTEDTTHDLSESIFIEPSGWKLDGGATLKSKFSMASLSTKPGLLLATTDNQERRFLSCPNDNTGH